MTVHRTNQTHGPNPRRMSVAPAASQMRALIGGAITRAAPP